MFIQGTELSPVGEVPKRSRTETPPPGASRLKFSREQRTGRKCLDRTMANGKCGGGLKRPAGNPLPLETGLGSPARPRIPPTLSAGPLRDTGYWRVQG